MILLVISYVHNVNVLICLTEDVFLNWMLSVSVSLSVSVCLSLLCVCMCLCLSFSVYIYMLVDFGAQPWVLLFKCSPSCFVDTGSLGSLPSGQLVREPADLPASNFPYTPTGRIASIRPYVWYSQYGNWRQNLLLFMVFVAIMQLLGQSSSPWVAF